MRLGLIDAYQLFVHPVVLGSGTPFFPALDDPINLRLTEIRTFGSGVVYLRYQRADAGQYQLPRKGKPNIWRRPDPIRVGASRKR